jgi:hypothetical protein
MWGIRCTAASPHHCERGEAIDLSGRHAMDCFAPSLVELRRTSRCARNDEGTSYPRRRVSSTLRPIVSITAASGILDRPPSRTMTTKYGFAFSRPTAPEVCMNLSPPSKTEGAGNAGCTLHPRSRVHDVVRCAHEHTGTVGTRRHSLRNGLTAYAELSLETNSFCLHRCRLDGSTDPVGSNAPPAA